MNHITIIDSRASGFNGEPMRVLAICNTTSGKVLIKKLADIKEPVTPKGDTLVVTDNPRLPHFGLLFQEKIHTKELISSYVQAIQANNLQFEGSMVAYDPKGHLQAVKMDEAGVQYEFNADINNGVLAVLLAIWGAKTATQGQSLNRAINHAMTGDVPLPTPHNLASFMALPFSV